MSLRFLFTKGKNMQITEEQKKRAISFISRNALWIVGFLFTYSALKKIIGLTDFIRFVVMMEAIAVILSMLALYAYTHFDYTKTLSAGEDKEFNSTERYAYQQVIGKVFLGVHILVGICTLTMYSGTFIK